MSWGTQCLLIWHTVSSVQTGGIELWYYLAIPVSFGESWLNWYQMIFSFRCNQEFIRYELSSKYFLCENKKFVNVLLSALLSSLLAQTCWQSSHYIILFHSCLDKYTTYQLHHYSVRWLLKAVRIWLSAERKYRMLEPKGSSQDPVVDRIRVCIGRRRL